jgi:glutamine amidotransferase
MSDREVVLIDYGVGNLLSVRRSLEHCGAKVVITADPKKILSGSRVVLPGVGAFANAMVVLNELELAEVIREVAKRGTPLLGICLGMQLLFDESEEFGRTKGLGLIQGKVVRIPGQTVDGNPLKIPHIGWNNLHKIEHVNWTDTLLADICPGESTYFVHSFMAQPSSGKRLAECIYGGHGVAAVIMKDNIVGCQFHPEKSGHVGLRITRKFLLS